MSLLNMETDVAVLANVETRVASFLRFGVTHIYIYIYVVSRSEKCRFVVPVGGLGLQIW